MAETKKTEEFLTYKGRPLVRCGDEIYYGNMEEPYVIRMQIKSKKEVNGLEIADKVTVQLMATDPYLSPRKQLVKSSENRRVMKAIDELPPNERKILSMHVIESKSYTELEQETGLKQNYLRQIVMRAKNKLTDKLKGHTNG